MAVIVIEADNLSYYPWAPTWTLVEEQVQVRHAPKVLGSTEGRILGWGITTTGACSHLIYMGWATSTTVAGSLLICMGMASALNPELEGNVSGTEAGISSTKAEMFSIQSFLGKTNFQDQCLYLSPIFS